MRSTTYHLTLHRVPTQIYKAMNRIQLHKILDPSIALVMLFFLSTGCGDGCGEITDPGPKTYLPYLIQPSSGPEADCGGLSSQFVSGSDKQVYFNLDRLNSLAPGDTTAVILAGDTTAFILQSSQRDSTPILFQFGILNDAQGRFQLSFEGNQAAMYKGVFNGSLHYQGKDYGFKTCHPGHYRIGEMAPKTPPTSLPFLIQPSNSRALQCGKLSRQYVLGSAKRVEINYTMLGNLSLDDTAAVILAGDTTNLVLKSIHETEGYPSKQFFFSVLSDSSGDFQLTFNGYPASMDNGYFIGEICYKREFYDLKTCESGHHQMRKINMEALKRYGSDADTSPNTGELAPKPCIDCGYEYGNRQIDLMIVYTDSAMNEAGGQAQIEANIIHRIEKTNKIFSDHMIPIRLHLNHIGEYKDYPEEVESEDLSLKTKLESHLINDTLLAQQRDQVGADLYIVFVKNANSEFNGYASQGDAMAVIRSSTQFHRQIFAHEIGHLLLGSDHDNCYIESWGLGFMGVMGNKNGYVRMGALGFQDRGCDPNLITNLIKEAMSISANRCLILPPYIVILDSRLDNGSEPSSVPDTLAYLCSPYIYNRNNPDSKRVHFYQNQNPRSGSTNYLYVMIRNGSQWSAVGSVSGYFYPAMLNPEWSDLHYISTKDNTSLPPNATEALEISIPSSTAIPPEVGFVAYFHPVGAPGNLPGSLFNHVLNSNQIAARAEAHLAPLPKNIAHVSPPITNSLPANRSNPIGSPTVQPAPSNSNPPGSFIDKSVPKKSPSDKINLEILYNSYVTTSIKLRPTFANSLRFRFMPSPETKRNFLDDGGEFKVTALDSAGVLKVFEPIFKPRENPSPVVPIQNLAMDAQGIAECKLRFFSLPTAKATYPLHLELLENGKVIGAYTYQVRTKP